MERLATLQPPSHTPWSADHHHTALAGLSDVPFPGVQFMWFCTRLTARIMRSLFRPVFPIHSSLPTPHESVTPIKDSLTRVFQCDSP
jgi:hypothetical protein